MKLTYSDKFKAYQLNERAVISNCNNMEVPFQFNVNMNSYRFSICGRQNKWALYGI